ncbi:MAG: hypothetical protein WDW38_010579 [Sanguina aurantia]
MPTQNHSSTQPGDRARPMRDLTDARNGVAGSLPVIHDLANLFDNDSATEATLPAGASEVSWHFPAAQHVTLVTLTSAATIAAPANWRLQASSDGKHWRTIDTRSGERFPSPRQTRVFGVKSPGSYAYYRLRFSAGAERTTAALAEIELIGPVTPSE